MSNQFPLREIEFQLGISLRLELNRSDFIYKLMRKIIVFSGFSTVKPWYSSITIQPSTNLEKQRKENGSFAIFKSLNKLRVKEASLHSNKITMLAAVGSVVIFHRYEIGSKGFIIALNFDDKKATVSYNAVGLKNTIVEIDTSFTMKGRELGVGTITLAPLQGLVLRVLE